MVIFEKGKTTLSSRKKDVTIREYLKNNVLITDGAFGTYYATINKSDACECELGNITNPEVVMKIHREYINAGAKLIRTNTFASNTVSLKCTKDELRENIKKAYEIALLATNNKELAFLGADIGPIPENFSEYGNLQEEYRYIADVFLECGADIFVFETFSSTEYLIETAKYIKSKNENAFILAQFCFNRYGYTKSGMSLRRIVDIIDKCDYIDALGINCGIGSAHMMELLKKLNYAGDKYLSVMPNSSYPEIVRDRTIYLNNSSYFAKNIASMCEYGADIVGGCCGTSPEFIRNICMEVEVEREKNFIRETKVVQDKKTNDKVIKNEFLEKLNSKKRVVAVELDPPFDAKIDKIMENANVLKNENIADMITFADSPSGRPRIDSILMATKVINEVKTSVMPHLCCRDRNSIAMFGQIMGAYVNGVRNMLIVTGDPIPSAGRTETSSVFDFNSVKLMEFVKQLNEEHFSEEPIVYGGALNQGRKNIDKEIERMQKKILAGASYFLTQPIYSDEDIERIKYIKSKVDTKILCGIMPLVSYRNASFIKNELAGINVPDEVIARYSENMTREEGEAVGIAISREIIEKLDGIADGIYFMVPFNRVHLVKACLS